MAKKKQCTVCKNKINLSQKQTFLKCPFCEEIIHKLCSNTDNLCFNGYFYCQNHAHMKPAAPVRNNRPARQALVNSECQKIAESVASASKIIQSTDPLENVELDADQRAALSDSIAFINEILEQSSKRTEPKSRIPPHNNHVDSSATSTTINPKTNQAPFYNRISNNRIPNFPPAILLPPPFTPDCQKCRLQLTEPFFKCLNCKQSWHDKCITGNERLNQVKGYWVCAYCKNSHDVHERIMNYCGNDSSILQDKHEREAEMFANLNIDDAYFNPPRLSQYAFRFPIPKSLSGAVPKANKTSGEVNQQKNTEKVSQKQDKMVLEKLRIEKAIEELSLKKKQLDSQIMETTKESHHIPQRNSPLISPSNSSISIHESKEANDIERMVEESIRRMNPKPLEDHYDLSRKLFELQLRESQKRTYYTLPKVTKLGYEWKIFYTAFLESFEIYSPNENVIRLQEAIQCPEIKKLGGINLFTSATFEKTLKEIDKRIGKPEKMLIREKQKLIGYSQLRNHETKEIIDFIEEIKAYSTLVDKIGNYGDKNDQALIARLSRILPDRLLNGWTREYNKIKAETEEVLLNDMSTWLDKQIDTFETGLLFKQIDPYGDLRQKHGKTQEQSQKVKTKQNRNDQLFFHKTDDTSLKNEETKQNSRMTQSTNGYNESPANFCWYHNRKGHSSLYCYTLLSKKGKEVQELAKSKGICLICSNKVHSPCPQKEKFVCLIPDCPMKHATIFCPKRKCQNTTSIPKKTTNANNDGNARNQIATQSQSNNMKEESEDENEYEESMSQTTFDALHMSLRNAKRDENYDAACMIREISMHANCQSNPKAATKTLSTSSSLVSVITLKLESGGKTLKCALLLDSGSTTSLLDEKYADMLQLKGPNKELKLSWSGGQKRIIKDSMIIKASAIGFHDEAKSYEIYFRTVKDLGMPPQMFNADEIRKKFNYLADLPLISYSHIVGVIGTDQWWFFKQLKWIESSRKNSVDSPVALLTPLGYCLIGSSCPLSKLHSHMNNINMEERSLSHSIVKLSEEEEEELMKMEARAIGLDYRQPYEQDRVIAEDQAGLKILMEKVKIQTTIKKIEKANVVDILSFFVTYHFKTSPPQIRTDRH